MVHRSHHLLRLSGLTQLHSTGLGSSDGAFLGVIFSRPVDQGRDAVIAMVQISVTGKRRNVCFTMEELGLPRSLIKFSVARGAMGSDKQKPNGKAKFS